jgi:hypothetical protein
MVSIGHIDVLVAGALFGPRDAVNWQDHDREPFEWYFGSEKRWINSGNADEIGDMLVRECFRSVHYRYEDADEIPGPDDPYWGIPYRFVRNGANLAGAQVATTSPSGAWLAKQLDHYEYQACEHPEWAESEASALVCALRLRILKTLPGYDEAPWGVA